MAFVAAFCDSTHNSGDMSLSFLIQSNLPKRAISRILDLGGKAKLFFMKLTFLWIVFSSMMMTNAALSQTSKRDYNIANSDEVVMPESKAVKNFKRSHPDVSNESWRIENDYYFVSYKTGDISYKIAYTPDGHVDYSLKMYKENGLPSRVRSAVKSTYYDYQITDVQELDLKTETIYLIKITDTYTWKTIRVNNGDLEEIENYSTVISPCR
jgi:hypothetical protein